MDKVKKYFPLSALALLALFLLSACSSSLREAAEEEAPAIAKIGITKCYNCHSDDSNPAGLRKPFGDTARVDVTADTNEPGWINSPHANNETITLPAHTMSDTHPSNAGWPYYGYSDLGVSASCTLDCHDQLGDGKLFENFFLDTSVSALGNVNRPVTGCESCHGGGENHYGVGPLEYPEPGASRCAQCHNSSFDHLQYHPEGGDIFEDYITAPHYRSINVHVTTSDSDTDVRARCSRCHSDEGARRYVALVNGTETNSEIKAALDGKSDIVDGSNIQCRTCHDAHNPLRLLGTKVKDYATLSDMAGLNWSDEFITCTSCHQLLKSDGTRNLETYHAPVDGTGTVVNSYGDFAELIADTHFDIDGGEADSASATIEGYIIDPTATHSTSSTATPTGICRDCHNQHNADTTIHNDWATSGHGGRIKTIKDAAAAADPETAYTAGVTNSDAPAWANYGFATRSGGACSRCHTATGAMNYLKAPTTYDPVNNVFTATGGQRELLYCWACHTNNKGGLRDPGALTVEYDSSTTADDYVFSDLEGSNICVACHSGRIAGKSVKAIADADMTSKSFPNSHYLAAAGTLFDTIGFEFSDDSAAGVSSDFDKNYGGRSYANVAYFKHDTIGLTATGTGTNGPCVGCHMKSANPHKFTNIVETSGQITDITTQAVCNNCHTVGGPYEMTASRLQTEREELESTLLIMQAIIRSKGAYYDPGTYPYFFTSTSFSYPNRITDWTAFGTANETEHKQFLGACFNLGYLDHDPGAYAHNRYYTKRLIWDSIDFVYNFAIDSDVVAAIDSIAVGTTVRDANGDYSITQTDLDNANAYLGTSRPGG